MAITNAQQYQQLVNKPADGKRPGYRGVGGYRGGPSGSGGGVGKEAPGSKGSGFETGQNVGRDRDETPPQQIIGGKSYDVLVNDLENKKLREEAEERDVAKRQREIDAFIEAPRKKTTLPGMLGTGLNLLSGILPDSKKFFVENVVGKYGYDMTEEDYQDYMKARSLGEVNAYGRELTDFERGTGPYRDDQPIIPLSQAPVTEEPELDPNSLEGILANRIAYRFMADGGRAGYQQGGEIMPRLNQLGSGVSSAEQTLQQINQRLQSAESSLGSGGQGTLANMSNANFNTSIGGLQLAGGATQQPAFGSMEEAYADAQKSAQETRAGGMMGRVVLPGEMSFEDFSNQMNIKSGFFGMHGAGGVPAGGNNMQQPMQSPLATAIGLASGGRVGLMGGGMPYEGGIMDLESARQMYGLGKLVKKATGAIKKIVKSPVGKAALAFGMYKFGAPLFKSEGFKNFFLKDASKKFALDNLSGKGVLTGIGGLSALAGLFAGQDEEDEVQPYYRGPGLDIDAIRRNPYGTKGPAFGFYAKGGDVKEPVAKDTMPLLDMNGMEKDYRADGGFVPIGRMERADDVPARLSKNEFVFTADAVRNAGDGDIDKGAEVMYNVMKNLEAGGDISEESQGLNGARNMFQTSKRLEEVL